MCEHFIGQSVLWQGFFSLLSYVCMYFWGKNKESIIDVLTKRFLSWLATNMNLLYFSGQVVSYGETKRTPDKQAVAKQKYPRMCMWIPRFFFIIMYISIESDKSTLVYCVIQVCSMGCCMHCCCVVLTCCFVMCGTRLEALGCCDYLSSVPPLRA